MQRHTGAHPANNAWHGERTAALQFLATKRNRFPFSN